MVSQHQKKYNGEDIEVNRVKGQYTERGELYGWEVVTGDMRKGVRAFVHIDWLTHFLENPNTNGSNSYAKPLGIYLKEHTENVPDKILSLLARHPEFILVTLAALFPTMLNIPIFKMLMARKLGG